MMQVSKSNTELPDDGLAIFAKKECPTCMLVEPLLSAIEQHGVALAVCTQDDPDFPSRVSRVIDDTELEFAFRYNIETVPTLIRLSGGKEAERVVGWHREDWRRVSGIADLGEGLPTMRPGCGSKSTLPGIAEQLTARYGSPGFKSRGIEIDEWSDPEEACFDRGWTDGLPVVPPTDARIIRMLSGTARKPDEIVGRVPPLLAPCTVEKVAINAVMAGCKPEYMPVVLAALEAAFQPIFSLHGLLCTTCFSGPVIVVNGPVAKRIGMNWGINALGQGNRANASIGRAIQLIVRNVGSGRPGELDRATLGGPGKYTFCFAEDETDPTWEPLSVARGVPRGKSAVTLFQGDGIQGFIDQRSRTPEELIRSLAMSLVAVGHPKLAQYTNAMLVLSPEHYTIFRASGWGRARIEHDLLSALIRPGRELVQGAQGVGEGIPSSRAEEMVPKFCPDGLFVVRAGGSAGLFSAILAGWTAGRFSGEIQPVTMEIRE